MRIESSVTSLSWIPLGAVEASTASRSGSASPISIRHHRTSSATWTSCRQPTASGSPTASRPGSRCGTGTSDAGQTGGGRINVTKVGYGSASIAFTPIALPDLRPEPEIGPTWARFAQTSGGQTGFPAPRRVRHEPYVQIGGPVTWSTLGLTIHADGSSEPRLAGASSFPGTGSTTTPVGWSPRAGSSTTTPGGGRRSAATRPGVPRTRPRS